MEKAKADNRKTAVVAGGGPSGLFAGWKLAEAGWRVVVLEREADVGGLAACPRLGNNHYSYGTHHLHSPDPEGIKPFRQLVGDDLIELQRKLEIKFMNRFYPYPLSTKDLLLGMNPWVMITCLLSLGRSLVTSRFRKERPANAEEAIIGLYGQRLYDIMFRDYTARFWGMPVERISTTFVDKRMPGINAVENFKKWLQKVGVIGKKSMGKTTVIGSGSMYTTPTGVGRVYEAMAAEIERLGGEVRREAEVLEVRTEDNLIRSVVHGSGEGTREEACEMFVSTMPISHLVARMRPEPPPSVMEATRRVTFRALLVTALLVRPKRRLGSMFTYYPDRIFHRLAETGSPVSSIDPPGSTILLAEMTCDVGDPVWENPASIDSEVVSDLVAEGLIDPDGVLEIHHLRAPEGYPRYALGFEPALEALREYLGHFNNVVSTGRQGGFQFTSMIPSMQMAWKNTRDLLERMDTLSVYERSEA